MKRIILFLLISSSAWTQVKTPRVQDQFNQMKTIKPKLHAVGGSLDGGGGNALVCFSDLEVAKRVQERRLVLDDEIPFVTSVKTLRPYPNRRVARRKSYRRNDSIQRRREH